MFPRLESASNSEGGRSSRMGGVQGEGASEFCLLWIMDHSQGTPPGRGYIRTPRSTTPSAGTLTSSPHNVKKGNVGEGILDNEHVNSEHLELGGDDMIQWTHYWKFNLSRGRSTPTLQPRDHIIRACPPFQDARERLERVFPRLGNPRVSLGKMVSSNT